MLEHLLDHRVALLHVVCALAALGLGVVIVSRQKGTVSHRLAGRAYLAAMVLMNASALADYELYGRFGPFHWMALVSLLSVAGGQVAARRRRPGWIQRHAYWMSGSFVGLVAATAAEVASRVPGWAFGSAVVASSAAVILSGVVLLLRRVPRAVAGVADARLSSHAGRRASGPG